MAQPPSTSTPPKWSPDGRWWWDGRQWIPAPQPQMQPLPAPQPQMQQAAPYPIGPPQPVPVAVLPKKPLSPYVRIGCAALPTVVIFGIVLVLFRDLLDALIVTTALTIVIAVGLAGRRGRPSARMIPATFRIPVWALSIFWVIGPTFGLFLWRECARGDVTDCASSLASTELWWIAGSSAAALVGSLITLSFSLSLLSDRIRHRAFLQVRQLRYQDLSDIRVRRRDEQGGPGTFVLTFQGGPGSRPIAIWATNGVYRTPDIDWALSRIAEHAPQVAGQAEIARSAIKAKS